LIYPIVLIAGLGYRFASGLTKPKATAAPAR
jgi:hypothetical protein